MAAVCRSVWGVMLFSFRDAQVFRAAEQYLATRLSKKRTKEPPELNGTLESPLPG